MKVYIVHELGGQNEHETLGVFSSLDKARKFCDDRALKRSELKKGKDDEFRWFIGDPLDHDKTNYFITYYIGIKEWIVE